MHLKLGCVIIVRGPHRAHDRQIISTASQMRQPVAHFQPNVTVLPVTDLHGKNSGMHFAIESDNRPGSLQKQWQLLRIRQVRFVVCLTAQRVQQRFRIERFHLTDATRQKDPDDFPGLWD